MDWTSDGGPGVDRELLSGARDERALDAQVEELERIVDATVDSIIILDEGGEVRFADGGTQSLLGYDGEQVIGEPIGELLAPNPVVSDPFDVASAPDLHREVLDGGEVSGLDVPFGAADGTVVPVSLSTVSVEDGRVVCLLQGTELHERAFARRVIDSAGDPMYALDREGTIRWANEAMGRYTGYGREALLGRPMSELVPVQEYRQATEHLLELADGKRAARTVETTLVTSNGESILTEARLVALTDEDDAYAGSVGVLRDIRERKERERDLELLKKVLTRVFRHNVRNELTVIQGHAELVRLSDDEELADHGDAIIKSAERLFDHSEKARLIERVLETETLAEKDLTREVNGAVKAVTWKHSDAAIDVDVPAAVAVEAHPEIRKAIEELIENAIIHAPPNEQPDVTVWLDEDDRTVTLYVEDNSGGLADHELEVLREGKETDLEHGSGVGLWLVRWLVEASEAELIVYRVNDGTLMGIRLRRAGSDG